MILMLVLFELNDRIIITSFMENCLGILLNKLWKILILMLIIS